MNGDLNLALAFATGLFGALHCLGMCSGIAGGFFVHYRRRTGRTPLLLYHGTRILLYSALGIAGAALGRVLVQTGLFGKAQGVLMMAAGGLILLLGLDLLGWVSSPRRSAGTPGRTAGVEVRFSNDREAHRLWTPVLAGALNGLVPCSLVFSIALKATATADPLRAGMLMAAFGLGTLPAMGLVSWTGSVIGDRARGGSARIAGLLVVALGLWTIYEGFIFFDVMRGLANW